jgi:hypothetical protein
MSDRLLQIIEETPNPLGVALVLMNNSVLNPKLFAGVISYYETVRLFLKLAAIDAGNKPPEWKDLTALSSELKELEREHTSRN